MYGVYDRSAQRLKKKVRNYTLFAVRKYIRNSSKFADS